MKKGESKGSGWKFELVRLANKFCAKVVISGVGGYFIETKKIKYDYRKYLGPDWKPNFDGTPSTVVTPHTSWLDIFMQMYR